MDDKEKKGRFFSSLLYVLIIAWLALLVLSIIMEFIFKKEISYLYF